MINIADEAVELSPSLILPIYAFLFTRKKQN